MSVRRRYAAASSQSNGNARKSPYVAQSFDYWSHDSEQSACASYSGDTASKERRRSTVYSVSSNLFTKLALVIGIVLIASPWMYQYGLRRRISNLKSTISSLVDEETNLVSSIQKTVDQIKQYESESQILEESNSALLGKLLQEGKFTTMQERSFYKESVKDEKALYQRLDQLSVAIQRDSEREVKNKYGMGPFRIRVHLSKAIENLGSSFVIQTTRLDVMPHSIHFFLQMIEKRLWNGLQIVALNGQPKLQAVPIVAVSNKSAISQFEKEDVSQLMFNEYDELQPLEHYSVAFSGQSGGPDFFIKLDKSETDNDATKDSCFGKVTEGRQLLDALLSQSTTHKPVAVIESIVLE